MGGLHQPAKVIVPSPLPRTNRRPKLKKTTLQNQQPGFYIATAATHEQAIKVFNNLFRPHISLALFYLRVRSM